MTTVFRRVACQQCDTRLLQSVEGNITNWYVYRAAIAGPASPTLAYCPGCGVPMTLDLVMDVVGEEENLESEGEPS